MNEYRNDSTDLGIILDETEPEKPDCHIPVESDEFDAVLICDSGEFQKFLLLIIVSN